MMQKITYPALFALLLLFSCSQFPEKAEGVPVRAPEAQVKDSMITPASKGNSDKGIAGVFDVPEMLCLSRMDSAPAREIPKRVPQNFLILHKEMERVGAEQDGPPGQLNYNNDTSNFKFECVVLIREMPKIQPKNCNVVVLEASKMVIYNYYGPYGGLYNAYREIGDYCRKNNFVQTGPQREFYVTDPGVVKDPSRRLTRIMVPVMSTQPAAPPAGK
jgi:effector-binding domain-containing protein